MHCVRIEIENFSVSDLHSIQTLFPKCRVLWAPWPSGFPTGWKVMRDSICGLSYFALKMTGTVGITRNTPPTNLDLTVHWPDISSESNVSYPRYLLLMCWQPACQSANIPGHAQVKAHRHLDPLGTDHGPGLISSDLTPDTYLLLRMGQNF